MEEPQSHSPSRTAASDQAPSAPLPPTTEAAAAGGAVAAVAVGSGKKHTTDARGVLDISHHPGRGRNRRPIVAMGLLLAAAAFVQAVLASRIRDKEIQINLVFFAESKYPTAGAPIVGALGLGVAFCFAVLCVLAKNDSHGAWVKRTRRAAMIYSIVALVAMTVCSFGERAVYRQLDGYEQCTDNMGSDNIERGDCVCWSDAPDDSVEVYIASDAGISCDSLLDYVDGILTSYVLMLSILVLTALGLWCRPYPSREAILSVVLEATPQPYVVTPTKAQQYGGSFSR